MKDTALYRADKYYFMGAAAFHNGGGIESSIKVQLEWETPNALSLSRYFWEHGYIDAKAEYEAQQKLNEQNKQTLQGHEPEHIPQARAQIHKDLLIKTQNQLANKQHG